MAKTKGRKEREREMKNELLKLITIVIGFLAILSLVASAFMYESDTVTFEQALIGMAVSIAVYALSVYAYGIIKALQGRQPKQGNLKNNQLNYSIKKGESK